MPKRQSITGGVQLKGGVVFFNLYPTVAFYYRWHSNKGSAQFEALRYIYICICLAKSHYKSILCNHTRQMTISKSCHTIVRNRVVETLSQLLFPFAHIISLFTFSV